MKHPELVKTKSFPYYKYEHERPVTHCASASVKRVQETIKLLRLKSNVMVMEPI